MAFAILKARSARRSHDDPRTLFPRARRHLETRKFHWNLQTLNLLVLQLLPEIDCSEIFEICLIIKVGSRIQGSFYPAPAGCVFLR